MDEKLKAPSRYKEKIASLLIKAYIYILVFSWAAENRAKVRNIQINVEIGGADNDDQCT